MQVRVVERNFRFRICGLKDLETVVELEAVDFVCFHSTPDSIARIEQEKRLTSLMKDSGAVKPRESSSNDNSRT
jgi:hypothetical protein